MKKTLRKIFEILVDKTKNKKISTLLLLWGTVYNILTFVSMVTLLVSILLLNRNANMFWVLSIIFIIVSISTYVIAILIRASAREAIPLVLYNRIDFDNYIHCLNFIKNKSGNKRLLKKNLYYLTIGEIEVLFFKGKFKDALKKIKEVDIDYINRNASYSDIQLKYYYLYFHINLFLNNIEEVNKAKTYFESTRYIFRDTSKEEVERFLKKHITIYRIFVDKKSDLKSVLSDKNPIKTRLMYLYNDLYFNALNKKLSGDLEESVRLLEILSKENEELFFVREAKKELIKLLNKDGGIVETSS